MDGADLIISLNIFEMYLAAGFWTAEWHGMV